MKTIEKIILYAAAGAALLGGALGCGKEKESLDYRIKPEARVESASEVKQDCGISYLQDLAESSQKFSEQLDLTDKSFQEAIDFDKKCQESMYKEDEKARQELEKEFGSFEDWLKRRSK